ncbi:DUF2066 domain-containing protein [Pleionea litopenaei]|uniref:DUF2066 domain-containing protein n=1 Tax=Pleionea litopenaei TaxID=3070815 RepID=A0AA51RU66_9GAMM|nr:DUF2066 domain-containing protein [Pleionea sp. HL-JVS1]WMS87539.1 DUF2066 domain-containing protein [Pleionea sp. HL-JVS1]
MRVIFLSLVVFLFSSQIDAAAQSERFSVAVEVADRSQSAQQTAMIRAFREVIIRASGTRRALEAFYVQESFKKVATYIRTYEYRDGERDPETGVTPLLLVVSFDANSVRRLLQDSAVPMWSGSIPVTLVWMAHEYQPNRQVVSSSTPNDDPVKRLIETQAKRRGLPVLFPLMDLEDEMVISVSDIWGRFADPIINASQRYGSDVVVAGRLIEDDGQWQGRYLLKIGERQFFEDFSAETDVQVVEQLIDWLGESLCDVYCVTESYSNNNQQQLLIQDIGSYYSFRSMLNYLERLSAIRKVEVVAAKGRSVLLAVDLVGEVESLQQAISLDDKLVPVTDSATIEKAYRYISFKEGIDTKGMNEEGLPKPTMGGLDPQTSQANEAVVAGATSSVVPNNNSANPTNPTQASGPNNVPTVDLNGLATPDPIAKALETLLVYRWRP